MRVWSDMRDVGLMRLVNFFAEHMKHRLKEKEDEGYSGWSDPETIEVLVEKIANKLFRLNSNFARQGCYVDIGNMIAMLWNFPPEEMAQRFPQQSSLPDFLRKLADKLEKKV